MYNIHLLPASFGDSILIEYGKANDPHYILIDGGPYFVYDEIMDALKEVAPELKTIDLLVVTHIDIDHIDGIVKLLNSDELPFGIKDIWFNGWEQLPESDVLGGIQGEYLGELIKSKDIPHNLAFEGKPIAIDELEDVIEFDTGLKLTLLSPNKKALSKLRDEWEKTVREAGLEMSDTVAILEKLREDHRYEDEEEEEDILGDMDIEELAARDPRGDKSAANGSSIAFIAEYEGKRCLFAGDAHSDKLKDALEERMLLDTNGKLKLDVWKLAHHGSRKSTLDYLMEMIDCKRFLISSDGKRYHHPDAETLAKLIKINGPELEFHFNHRSAFAEKWEDPDLEKEFKYKPFYPSAGKKGISIRL